MSSDRTVTAEPGPVDPAVVIPAEAATVPVGVAIVPGEVDVAVEPIDSVDPAPPARVPASRWGRVFGLLAIAVAGFSIYGLGTWLVDTWQSDRIGGSILAILSLVFLGALAKASIGEFLALRRLREATRFRADLAAALHRDSPAEIAAAMAPVLAMVTARRPDLGRQFHHRVDGQSDSAAMVRQFRSAVLAPLDQEARRVVRREAFATLGAVAVSPHPALDVAIVLWRSIAMVRRIADIYGLRPSGLATIRLARMVVVSAAAAMAADPAGEALADALGGGVANKLAGKLTEGSITGFRAMRLGIRAIDVCRPLPFEPEERKGLLRTLLDS
jgi:putative membrane protein